MGTAWLVVLCAEIAINETLALGFFAQDLAGFLSSCTFIEFRKASWADSVEYYLKLVTLWIAIGKDIFLKGPYIMLTWIAVTFCEQFIICWQICSQS